MEQLDQKTGKMIRNSLIQMYPGAFLYAIMIGFVYMIDSIIAGNALGAEAISAVAIGLPGYGMFLALMNAIVHGTSLRITWAKGRANHEEFQRAFAGGLTFSGICGFLLMSVVLIFSTQMARAFGGGKVSEVIFAYSVLYIRCCAPMILLAPLSGCVRECIGMMGYQFERAMLSIVNMSSNLVISILCVMSFPADLKMAGLGIGSSMAALIELIVGIILVKKRKLNIRLQPMLLNRQEIKHTLISGIPVSLDNIIDCIVAAVVNNLILMLIPGEPLILSVVAVVNNIKKIARCAAVGIGYDSAPLLGIFFAQRDKSALKKTFSEAMKMGLVITTIWSVICFVLCPLLSKLCGMELTEDIQIGVLISLIFVPSYLLVYMMTVFYETTERVGSSILVASIPDSLIYPLMIISLIPAMGKTGLWLAIGGNSFVGLLLVIPLMMLLSRKNPTVSERILRLHSYIVNRPSYFAYEITGKDETVVGISEKIQDYLQNCGKKKKTSYLAALSTEELAVDMINYRKDHPMPGEDQTKQFDIRLFDDGDSVEVLIRCMGISYDPLDFDADKKEARKMGVTMVQKIAQKVSYTYVYRLNVVSIVLDDI